MAPFLAPSKGRGPLMTISIDALLEPPTVRKYRRS